MKIRKGNANFRGLLYLLILLLCQFFILENAFSSDSVELLWDIRERQEYEVSFFIREGWGVQFPEALLPWSGGTRAEVVWQWKVRKIREDKKIEIESTYKRVKLNTAFPLPESNILKINRSYDTDRKLLKKRGLGFGLLGSCKGIEALKGKSFKVLIHQEGKEITIEEMDRMSDAIKEKLKKKDEVDSFEGHLELISGNQLNVLWSAVLSNILNRKEKIGNIWNAKIPIECIESFKESYLSDDKLEETNAKFEAKFDDIYFKTAKVLLEGDFGTLKAADYYKNTFNDAGIFSEETEVYNGKLKIKRGKRSVELSPVKIIGNGFLLYDLTKNIPTKAEFKIEGKIVLKESDYELAMIFFSDVKYDIRLKKDSKSAIKEKYIIL